MPKPALKGDMIEALCRGYWNAFRAGHLAVGGDKLYPSWDETGHQRAKDETRRCMRWAVEALTDLPDAAFGDPTDKKHIAMERGAFNKVLGTIFPDKPRRRSKKSELLSTEIMQEVQNAKLRKKMGIADGL